VDNTIHAAWLAAAQYLNYLSEHSYVSANQLRVPAWRTSHSPNDSEGTDQLDLSGYAAGGRGACLVYQVPAGSDSAIFDVSEDCPVKFDYKFVVLRLVMQKAGASEWLVQKIFWRDTPKWSADH
jgi:hypothetical protein